MHNGLYRSKGLAKDFVVAGTASESLYGACEAMFKPDMEPEELFETISQALISSVDRDCLSGWGGHVYVVMPTEVTEKILKGRMDYSFRCHVLVHCISWKRHSSCDE